MSMSMSMVVYECHFKLPLRSLSSGNKYLANFACCGMENTEVLVTTTSQLFLLLQKAQMLTLQLLVTLYFTIYF